MSRVESIQSISDWATATFTAKGTEASVCARAFTELAELNFALARPDGVQPDKVREECADVYITLARYCVRMQVEDKADLWVEDELPWLVSNHEVGRMVREAAMNLLLLQSGSNPKIHLTAVLTRMHRICTIHGGELHDEIDKKMVINRARVWAVDGQGHGQHVA